MENSEEARWYSIQADIASIRLVLFALVKTSPHQTALKTSYEEHKEILENVLIHSEFPEKAIERHMAAFSRLEQAIWG